MGHVLHPGLNHDRFSEWVKEQGVWFHEGIQPAQIRGRGIGIVARRAIRAGEKLVTVPLSALLTTDLVPQAYKKVHTGITVHGLLASYLTSSKKCYGKWRATWPSMEELEESMPLLWSPPTLDVELPKFTALGGSTPLPPEVGGLWMSVRLSTEQTKAALSSCLRSKQEMKLQKDWMIVKSALPHATYKDYAYNWLIINTRSLYYDLPTLLKPLTREDHMCLCPFVDYFNHADEEGCHVAFEEQSGFTVTSLRDYECGEELFVSYGPHPNDFLLVEYGFILETNKWDSLQIDALILSAIDDKAKERLRDAGYLGEHSLSREGVCHRTQVAVRTQTLNRRDWGHYVQGRATSIEEVDDEKKADAWICRQILMTYHNDAIHALKLFRDSCVRRPAGVTDPIRSVLQTRWMQIETMIRNAFNNSINPETRADFSRLWTADEV